MAIRLIQLKSIKPVNALRDAGMLSVTEKITAPVSMKMRICQGKLG